MSVALERSRAAVQPAPAPCARSGLAAEPMENAQASFRRWLLPAGAAAIAAIAGLVLGPIGRDDSHLGRAVLAALAVLLLALRAAVPAQLRRGCHAALVALAVTGWLNYYQFDARVVGGINDYTDVAYYYTNSKYLDELGYDGLYAGMLLCDDERGAPRTRHIATIRDLRNDQLIRTAEGVLHGRVLKRSFTPERWDAFCHDSVFFLDRIGKKSLAENFFVDHGYNPPPTWTLFGGNLAARVAVEQVVWVCRVDMLLIAAMLGVIGWAFGTEVGLWASLFYAVTFSGRWPILGMAILRFDWVAALAVGYALYYRQRLGTAAAMMAFAAWNRVFPAIFFWGWLVDAVRATAREGRIPRPHLRFVAVATLVSALMVGGAALQYGPQTLADSAHHLRLHNQSFSSHRVGLAAVMVYRGETTREEINQHGGMSLKERQVQAMMPWLRGLAVLLLAFIAAYGWKTGKPGYELIPLLVLPLYCATTPQVNYYNFRVLLVCWHGLHLDRRSHRWMLALLFVVEVVAQTSHVAGLDRYTVNTWSSIVLGVYLLVLASWMGMEMKRSPITAS